MKHLLLLCLLSLFFSCNKKNEKTTPTPTPPTSTSTVRFLNVLSTYGGYTLKINDTIANGSSSNGLNVTWQVKPGDNISFTHNCNPTTQFGPNGQNLGSFCQQISVSIKIDNSVVYNQNCFCTATYSTVIQ